MILRMSANRNDKSVAAQKAATERANTFPWPPALFVAAIAVALVANKFFAVAWPGVDDTPARVIGWVFGLLGFSLIAWSIERLISHGTTVMPDKTSTVLVTTGPYWRFRNPIYLGEVLLLLSAAEVTKNVWFVASAIAFAILVTVLQIIPEERHLQARFGEAYTAYKARTRRWI